MASPTLPQLTVSTTDPLASIERTVDCSSTGGYANTAARLAAFIAALADAKFKDYIITEPGDTLDGNFTLKQPATSGLGATSGYVVIRPRGFDSAVAIGKRATTNSGMTTLRSVASSGGAGHCDSVIVCPSNGTEYYWLSGLEVVPKVGTFCDGSLVLFSPPVNADNPTNQADHMMVDRCYIHGDDPSGTNGGPGTLRGLQFAGQYVGCINSTIDEIKCTDAQGEPQAITMGFGAGPVHIENNLLGCTTQSILFETPTGERIGSVTITGGTTVTRSGGEWPYDVVGKTFNLAGGSTATVATRNSDTVITLGTSVSNGTGVGYVDFNRSGNPSFFPGDITIKRNHMRKKAAWNIADATFERSSGGDTSLTSMTIHASDNTKIAAGTFGGVIGAGTQIFITGGSGWTTGYAYCTSVDGSSNAVMNRALGTVGSTGGTARKKYSVKNALEFKSGARVLVEGNVFDTSWSGGQNFILTFTPRYTNCPAGDLTFQYNKIKTCYGIAAITASESSSGGGTPGPYLENNRITMQHNLFENIQMTTTSQYTSPGANVDAIEYRIYATTDTVNGVVGGPTTMDDFVFEHNTVAGTSTAIEGYFMRLGNGEDPAGFTKGERFIFRNNVIFTPTAGAFGSAFSGSGSTALGDVSLGSTADVRSVTKNIFFDTSYNGSDISSPDTGNVVVTTANRSTINFTDYAGGDYSIASGTYNNWGSDGTDPGADLATLATKTAHTLDGNWSRRFILGRH